MAAKSLDGSGEEDAVQALRRLTDEFRDRLADTAEEIKMARRHRGEVLAEHVLAAYRRLVVPAGGRNDAQKLITSAFKENRLVEWTGYGMALVLFLLGVGLLVYAVIGPVDVAGRVASLIGGSVAEVVLVIPLRFSINARRHNFALRILGLMLDRVDDPVLLADCIRQLLGEITPNRGREESR